MADSGKSFRKLDRPSRVAPMAAVWASIVVAALAILTAIDAAAGPNCNGSPTTTPATMPAAPTGKAASFLDQFNTTGLTVPRDQLLRGGPAKDGIPALVNPKTVAAGKATFPDPDALVIRVTVGDQTRAYPIGILNWHEIANDELGGVPIAVIYCPLCNSASIIDRRIDDKTLTFGVSGLLHNSNVVLYDRTDQALWSQVGLTAISGPYVGRSLKHLPFEIMTFEAFKAAQPNATVLSERTGHKRDYRANPYVGYFATDAVWFPVTHTDARLPAKSRILGVKIGDIVRAYPLDEIRKAPDGTITETFDEGVLVVKVGDGQDELAVVAMPEEARIVYTFWFDWVAMHPKTQLWRHPASPATAPGSDSAPTSQP
ncbi:hypothetical protein LCGC14_0094590 [marine sediment metagenome]|uniref:DUF3179 domain-containing protein n=1 Tax=marine sediment metagenome TaxID=412755 RepID=A0A0F9YGL2_9ZZZZ|nr:DUF3179 domain-containing protein [Phycisphaerae bacterium]HDZ42582.1 DUF3179 domain-containing protein [Phycisphaerae bacterium]